MEREKEIQIINDVKSLEQRVREECNEIVFVKIYMNIWQSLSFKYEEKDIE